MLLIWFVLDNSSLLDELLEAWTDAGVQGITILDSTGCHRVRGRSSTHDMPLMLGLSRLLRTDQVGHNTLFAVVEGMAVVERVVTATERVVGDLSQPNTGLLFVVPVTAVWGLPKQPGKGL